ncbi:hypothetical protein [Natronobeatus ordinarius]|uniref:hypothetical protein n=1 Tax=Natronobeatus ordinarius TaxID=2963433 RepID=UPI0020CD744A|nr:hypothetical protein [Natronobeatus ordinarius]
MGTIVAVETDAGVVIAGDRRVTHGGIVTGDSATRVFDLDGIGAAAVGEAGAVDAFRRRLEAELEAAEFERRRELTVEVLGRIAARVAEAADVEAVVATRDDEGIARIRQVGADGSVLSNPVAALGSGAEPALGVLEEADRNRDLESTEALVRDVLEAVAERDPDTGEKIDSWSLASDEPTD